MSREKKKTMFIINPITYMRITHKIHIVELRERRVSKIVGRGQLPEILVEMGGFCEQEVKSHFWLCVSEKTLWVTKHTFKQKLTSDTFSEYDRFLIPVHVLV